MKRRTMLICGTRYWIVDLPNGRARLVRFWPIVGQVVAGAAALSVAFFEAFYFLVGIGALTK